MVEIISTAFFKTILFETIAINHPTNILD